MLQLKTVTDMIHAAGDSEWLGASCPTRFTFLYGVQARSLLIALLVMSWFNLADVGKSDLRY